MVAGELLGLARSSSRQSVIVARIVWVFPATYLPRYFSARIRARDPYPPVGNVFIVSWAGMRGVVSLAAALALPADFPARDFDPLPDVRGDPGHACRPGPDAAPRHQALHSRGDPVRRREEREARMRPPRPRSTASDDLAAEWPEHRRAHRPAPHAIRAPPRATSTPDGDGPRDEAEQELLEHRIIRRAVIDAERDAVISLRDRGVISDEVLRRVERDLDLEELRLEALARLALEARACERGDAAWTSPNEVVSGDSPRRIESGSRKSGMTLRGDQRPWSGARAQGGGPRCAPAPAGDRAGCRREQPSGASQASWRAIAYSVSAMPLARIASMPASADSAMPSSAAVSARIPGVPARERRMSGSGS